jgi:hypothetical protein
VRASNVPAVACVTQKLEPRIPSTGPFSPAVALE